MERKWWTLIAVSVAIFMLLLDITVVNVALPDIQRSLHSSFQDLQWVVNAYSLTLAAFLLTAGALSDLLGRRLVFTIGLVVFTISSAACGLSTSPLELNLFRGAQGVGGAMMFATSLALIAQAFHGKERGTAFGVYGARGRRGRGRRAGDRRRHHLGHRLGMDLLRERAHRHRRRVPNAQPGERVARPERHRRGLDRPRDVLRCAVPARVRPHRGQRKGVGLHAHRRLPRRLRGAVRAVPDRRARQRRPMLDLSLFRRPAFAGASIVAFCVSASMFSMFLYLTLYIQDVLRYDPLQAGLRFLPITLMTFVAAPISGRLSTRVPMRVLLGGGLLLVSAGLLAMTAVDASSGWTTLIPGFIIAGIGVGFINPPLAATAVGVVHYSRSGMASGINSTFRQVGIATGIAGLGAVFQHEVSSKTTAALASTGAGHDVLVKAHGHLSTALVSGEVTQLAHNLPLAAQAALGSAYRVGFTDAFTSILIIASSIALIGAVLAFALVRSRDFVASQQPETAGEAAGADLATV